MAELGQRQIQLADGLFDQMRGFITQAGDDHHEVTVRLARFVAPRGALVQRLSREQSGDAADEIAIAADAVYSFCIMVVRQDALP